MNRNCSACNMKIHRKYYLKNWTVCKSCYIKNRRKNNKNNTLIQNQQTKSENNDNDYKRKRKDADSVNNRTLILSFSNCGKTYLMKHILHQKQEPFFRITKSINQYPNIKAQTPNEIEPSENHENSTVVLDDMLLTKRESKLHMLFT